MRDDPEPAVQIIDHEPSLCGSAQIERSVCDRRVRTSAERILFVFSPSFAVCVGALKRRRSRRSVERVSVALGFGSDCSEEPADVRCDAGHAGFETSSSCPPEPTVDDAERAERQCAASMTSCR